MGRHARERVAAEGRSVVAGVEHLRRCARSKTSADRYAVAQPLGQCHDIGFDPEQLVREPFSGATAAALYFIEHEQPAMPIADSTQPRQIAVVGDIDPAFPLDGFYEDCDDVLVV